jgi:hypothetical protein
VADQARTQAEGLLGYLSDDFASELESFGRLNVLAEFSQRQIDYFHGLPPELKGPQTTRNAALAMVHYANAARLLGDLTAGGDRAVEAAHLLAQQRAAGDRSEATTIALARAYGVEGSILDNRNVPGGPEASRRAAELLRPLAERTNASVAARRAYVEILQRVGYEQVANFKNEDAIATEQKAMRLAAGLGARDLSDVYMSAYYVEACGWLVSALADSGRNAQARQTGEECGALGDKVLEQRPGYRLVLHGEQVMWGGLNTMSANELNPAEELRFAQRGEQVSTTLLALDPKNKVSANNLGVAHDNIGQAYWSAARLHEALGYWQKGGDDYAIASVGGDVFGLTLAYSTAFSAALQAMAGDSVAAEATLAKRQPFFRKYRQLTPAGSATVSIADACLEIPRAYIAYEHDDFATAARRAGDISGELQAISPHGDFQTNQRDLTWWISAHIAGRAWYQLKNFPAAEHAEREAVARRKSWAGTGVGDQRDVGEASTWLAMALARQGKVHEAAETIAPWVKFQRELSRRNHGDQWQPLELAAALYAEALSDPQRRPALLQEAAALVDHLAEPIRKLHDVRLWRERIQETLKGPLAESAEASATRVAG